MSHYEQAVLGCGLIDPTTIEISASILSPDDFADASLGQAFTLMADLHRSGHPIEHTTIVANLGAAGLLDAVGGVAGVARWGIEVGNLASVRTYAKGVKASADRRRLIFLANEIRVRAADQAADPAIVSAWIEGQLSRFISRADSEPITFADAIGDAIASIEQARAGTAPALQYGLMQLDSSTGGLFAGDLVIVAARPSIGKSAFAAGVAMSNAQADSEVLFVSLEMTSKDIALRHLAAAQGYEVRVLRSARVDDDDVREMRSHQETMAKVPFYLWSRRSATMAQIRSVAKVQKATKGLALLVVDYLGLVQSADRRKPRWESITEISGELKSLALELQIPVLALCQLNRQAEGGRPDLSHLRDAGAIEQDADVVLLLHREHRDAPKATIEIAKARNGSTGSIEVGFDCQSTKFIDEPSDAYEDFA
jgi:replicative DNA helicase